MHFTGRVRDRCILMIELIELLIDSSDQNEAHVNLASIMKLIKDNVLDDDIYITLRMKGFSKKMKEL
jgi:hypothetical protein